MVDLKFKSEGGWNQYIEWISIGKLRMDYQEFSKYNAMIWALVDIPFSYIHPMDENRYNDGMNMRIEFENLTSWDISQEAGYRDQCTVYEMMAALAYRCEHQLMRDGSGIDRTKFWFFEMCKNLDILKWDFDHLNYDYKKDIDTKIGVWLRREYEFDGRGGAFPIKNATENQKNVQIWEQMNQFLMEKWVDFDGLDLFKT